MVLDYSVQECPGEVLGVVLFSHRDRDKALGQLVHEHPHLAMTTGRGRESAALVHGDHLPACFRGRERRGVTVRQLRRALIALACGARGDEVVDFFSPAGPPEVPG